MTLYILKCISTLYLYGFCFIFGPGFSVCTYCIYAVLCSDAVLCCVMYLVTCLICAFCFGKKDQNWRQKVRTPQMF